MAVFSRRLAPLLWLAALPGTLAGQRHAGGRVVRVVEGDTLPLAGVPVVLHRVGPATQGPVDTVLADRRGRFGFRFADDSTAAWLLSARYGGIEYFSQPLSAAAAGPDTGLVVVVADTSSTAPVELRQRTVLVSEAEPGGGTRTVLDWFVLANRGSLTRVAPDTLHPSWGAPLPPEGQNVALADTRLSQFAPEALGFRGDSVLLFAPISPGEKELLLQYHVPGDLRRFEVPAAGVTDSVFVLLEDGAGTVATPGFAAGDTQTIDGRRFRRWAGLLGGAPVLTISLSGPLIGNALLLPLLVAVAGLGFAGLAVLLLRRRGARAPAPVAAPARTPLLIADEAARLEARYRGREAETPPAEWARYLADRARLREELDRALAGGRTRS